MESNGLQMRTCMSEKNFNLFYKQLTKMTDKKLTDKAIDIKGKKYVLVSDRVLYFNETYPNGSIVTQRIMTEEPWVEVFKATITPDCSKPERYFTWYSQAKWWDWFINKTSALENAETSSVWRWLAMMWIWVIDSIASLDEINKAENSAKTKTFKKESWFQLAMNNIDFIKSCLDEEDFIWKIKSKYEMDEIQEWQLRRRYQELNSAENIDLPFVE